MNNYEKVEIEIIIIEDVIETSNFGSYGSTPTGYSTDNGFWQQY